MGKQPDNSTRRPRFFIGPGLLVALAAAIVVVAWMAKQRIRETPAGPPVIERRVISIPGAAPGPVPEVKFLIDRSRRLALTARQVGALTDLQAEWEKLYYPKMKEANAAARRVDAYLSRAARNRKTPVAQIQKEAAPLIGLSSEIAAARSRYWGRAVALLTAEQRREADRIRKTQRSAPETRLPH